MFKAKLLLFSFLMFFTQSHAQTIGDMKQTYCGSGFTKIFVPEKFAGCDFSEACKQHDICYGRCDKHGDLYGSNYCKKSEQSVERKESKKQCDIKLRQDIINNNQGKCKFFARLYEIVVDIAGGGPFNGHPAQELYLAISETSESPEQAIQKLETIQKLVLEKKLKIEDITYNENQIILPLDIQNKGSELIQKNTRIIIPNDISIDNLRNLEQQIHNQPSVAP